MLRSVVFSSRECALERIVKVGDPPSKIAELAEKLDVDLIMMGRTGIGNSQVEVGHVTSKVLRLTSKPRTYVQSKIILTVHKRNLVRIVHERRLEKRDVI
jgi:urea-proton symporter